MRNFQYGLKHQKNLLNLGHSKTQVNRNNEKINKWKDISTKVEGLVHLMFSKCKRFSFVCHCSSLDEETFLELR